MFEIDFKPSLTNIALIGMSAVVFIVVAKYLMTRWPIPGLADVVNAV